MRRLALLALLTVTGCGDDSPQNKAAAAGPTAIAPGQWELTSEVTRFTQADHGAPRINTPVGTRTTANICVGAGAQQPTAFYSGDNFNCTYGTYYARNGMINLTLQCTRPGLTGQIPMTIDGTFQGSTIDYHRNLRTVLTTDGDVEIDTHVTGRRTGDCTPAATPAAAPAAGRRH